MDSSAACNKLRSTITIASNKPTLTEFIKRHDLEQTARVYQRQKDNEPVVIIGGYDTIAAARLCRITPRGIKSRRSLA